MTTSTPRPAPPDPAAPPPEEIAPSSPAGPAPKGGATTARPPEFGGPPGPEPTRYGDWEIKGRCIDF